MKRVKEIVLDFNTKMHLFFPQVTKTYIGGRKLLVENLYFSNDDDEWVSINKKGELFTLEEAKEFLNNIDKYLGSKKDITIIYHEL
jgi:hypothetical protein